MDDFEFTQGRAHLSRRRLTLKWGTRLAAWSMARGAAWHIDRHWTPERLIRQVEAHRTGTLWQPLVYEPPELQVIDSWACRFAGCHWRRGASPVVPRAQRVDDLWHQLKAEIPELKAARLRYLLSRDARRGRLRRVARGLYEVPPRRWRYADDDERDFLEREDEAQAQWWERRARWQRSRAHVVMLHYLLPHLQTYRKLRILGISERTYYYRLAEALDELDQDSRWMTRLQQNVQW